MRLAERLPGERDPDGDRYELVPYREVEKATWDQAIKDSHNGTFLHLRDYMNYHAHRFDEQSLMVRQQGSTLAVFPANRTGDTIVSHGGLTFGGLIYGPKLKAADVLDLMDAIAGHYRAMGCSRLRYKAIPHAFHRYPAQEDLYALFRLGARLVRRDLSSLIPLQHRLKLSDSRKNTIRKATRYGITVREGHDLAAFHHLLAEALARHGASPVHSLEELQLLKARFPEQIRMFASILDGAMLAGALVYDFGHVAHTQYLASSDEGKGLGALDGLLFHLIDQVYSDRCWFSFGISTEHEGQHLNEGLIFQKEGFGGRGMALDQYELDL